MINNYFILFRNFYKNQTKQIIIIEKDNKLIKNNWYIRFIQVLIFLNLTKYINLCCFNYIYKIDDIYFYHDIKKSNKLILYTNIIIEFLYNNIDIIDIIKKYHINVPLYIIFDLEKLEEYNCNIEIKVINFGKITSKIYNNYNEIKFKKLNELI